MKRLISIILLALIPLSSFSQEKVFPLQNAKAYTDIDMNGNKLQNLDVSNLPILFTSGSSILRGDGSGAIANVTIGSGLTFVGGELSSSAGGGTVTDFSSGDLSPLFTTSVATSTTTPALSFILTDADAHSFLGNNTSSSGQPAYHQLDFTDISGIATNDQIPDTLSSKTLDKTNSATFLTDVFTMQDNVDNTKQFVFSGVNIPTSTSRSVNIAGTGNSTTVVPDTGAGNNVLTAISANGVISKTQLSFSNLSGSASAGQIPDLDSITAPSADVSLNSHKITSLADPSGANDAVNKTYVDNAVSGSAVPHPSVKAATTANTALSGFLTIDGVVLGAVARVLVKDQTNPVENGIYVAAAGAWSRATDMDTGTEVPGSIFVSQGITQAATAWTTITPQPITVGSDPIAFTETGASTAYTAGVGLALSGNQFRATAVPNRISVSGAGIDISAAYVGQGSITTLGTVSTGTWNGSPILGTYGGTGINNGSNTITLNGNLATAGSGAITLTSSADTVVILPVSGILSTLSGSEALHNKSLDITNTAVLRDVFFTLQSSAHPTSQLQFDLSNLTAIGTYNAGVPDAPFSTLVVPNAAAGSQFVTGISTSGTVSKRQPAFVDITGTPSNIQLRIGTGTEAWDADLDALAALSGTDTIYYRSGANVWSPVTIGSGLTFTAGTLSGSTGNTPVSIEIHPANPTGTNNTTGLMMGLGATMTPSASYHGLVLVHISGTLATTAAGTGASFQIRYGTGSAPANGDALTGTAASSKIQYIAASNAAKVPFSCNTILSSLTPGTAIWIDLGLAAITLGTATITDVDISAVEM